MCRDIAAYNREDLSHRCRLYASFALCDSLHSTISPWLGTENVSRQFRMWLGNFAGDPGGRSKQGLGIMGGVLNSRNSQCGEPPEGFKTM
jgi:hypothetical protein